MASSPASKSGLSGRSFLTQYVGNLSLIVLAGLQSILILPIVLQKIDASVYGVWLASCSVSTLFLSAELGVPNYITRLVSVEDAKGDADGVGDLLGASIVISVLCLIAVAVGYLILREYLANILGISQEEAYILRKAFAVSMLDTALLLCCYFLGAVLVGIQAPQFYIWGLNLGALFGAIVSVALLRYDFGVIGLSIGGLCRPGCALVLTILGILKFRKRCWGEQSVLFNKIILKNILLATSWMGPSQIAKLITSQLENVIVIRVLGPSAVVMLTVIRKLYEFITQALSRASTSCFSVLARAREVLDRFDMLRLEKFYTSTLLIVSIGSGICVLFVNQRFVEIWTRVNWPKVFGLNLLVAVLFVMRVYRVSTYNMVLARGNYKRTSVSSIAEAVVQFGMLIVFSRIVGLNGVVMASVAGAVVGGGLQSGGVLQMLGEFKESLVNTKIAVLIILYSSACWGFVSLFEIKGWFGVCMYLVVAHSVFVFAYLLISIKEVKAIFRLCFAPRCMGVPGNSIWGLKG